MPHLQDCGEYKGHRIHFMGAAYQCPSLKLYGYATDRAIQGAIRRAIAARRPKTTTACDLRGPGGTCSLCWAWEDYNRDTPAGPGRLTFRAFHVRELSPTTTTTEG